MSMHTFDATLSQYRRQKTWHDGLDAWYQFWWDELVGGAVRLGLRGLKRALWITMMAVLYALPPATVLLCLVILAAFANMALGRPLG